MLKYHFRGLHGTVCALLVHRLVHRSVKVSTVLGQTTVVVSFKILKLGDLM